MKILTRNTDYAVKSLCLIAESNRLVSVSDLCGQLHIPKAFLRRILQTLNNKGFLNSSKGKGGGFSLARSPRSISLLDIMSVFQSPVKMGNCHRQKQPCPDQRSCNMRKKLKTLEDNILKEVKEISIHSLLDKPKSH